MLRRCSVDFFYVKERCALRFRSRQTAQGCCPQHGQQGAADPVVARIEKGVTEMFKFDNTKAYRAPISFSGYTFDPDAAAVYNDATTMAFICESDEERLGAYVPEGFEIIAPELQIMYTQSREVDWMAGSAYNLILVGVPVRYKGKRDRSEGIYSLVMWENHTVPILTGNLAMGVPKVFADIQDLHSMQDRQWTNASYEGYTFLELEINNLKPLENANPMLCDQIVNLFGWRYVPKVGRPGADLSQPIEFPQRMINEQGWCGTGRVNWTKLTRLQHPAHYHIIAALADLPVKSITAILTKGRMILQEGHGRVLE